MLTLYLNPEKSPAAVQTKVNGSPLAALKFKRGAEVPMRLVIVGSESASQLRVGIKGKNGFESDLLVFASADSGQPTEDGMAFDVVVSVASVALNDALHVGLGETLAPSSIAGMTEFSWQEGDSIRLSETIPTTVYNDIIRLASDAPEAAAGEYPAPELVATRAWVNSLRASAEAAGLVLLESDAVLVGEYSAVALTPSGTLAIAKASQNTRGTVLLGTGERISGRNMLPVGENASGGLAVDASGLSAYDIAVANGFIGTESAWLASLKGERGSKGEQGEPGKDADVEAIVNQAVAEVTTQAYETMHASTAAGTDNAEFYWCEIFAGHIPTGRLTSLALQCRGGAANKMSTSACYLGIWELNDAGEPVLLGVSTNTAVQAVGQNIHWAFDSVPLSGRTLRLCLLPSRDAEWLSGDLCFGARVSPCSDSCCMVMTSPQSYLPQMVFSYESPLPRFAPASHVSDTVLHVSDSDRQKWDVMAPANKQDCRYALFWDMDLTGTPVKLSDLLSADEQRFLQSMPTSLSGSFSVPLGEYVLLVCRGNDSWDGNDLMLATGGALFKFSLVRYFNFPFGQ